MKSRDAVCPFTWAFLGVLAMSLTAVEGMAQSPYTGASVSLELAYFTAGPGRGDGPPPDSPPEGRSGSDVNGEYHADDSACDDIYRGFFHPVGYSNVKIIDDGGANWGIAPHPGVSNTMSLTISSETENVDAIAVVPIAQPIAALGDYAESRVALEDGLLFIQFSIDWTSGWIPMSPAPAFPLPDAGNQNSAGTGISEGPFGDVFEALFGQWDNWVGVTWPGSNVYICDEDALGLWVQMFPGGINDMVDGIILEVDLTTATPVFDTDGTLGPETPWILFSLDDPVGETEKGTGNPISGADILTPSDGGPPVTVVWSAADLGLVPVDDIDALYVDPALEPTIIFSLDAGSPSLATISNPIVGEVGAEPCDLIHVQPYGIPPTPRVWAMGSELGLHDFGGGADDNLDALWITDRSLIAETVPVELSVLSVD